MSKEMMEVFTLSSDGNRVSTKTFVPRGTQVEEGYYIVGVNNWIVTPNGKVLVQKRAMNKKNNPGKWSSTNGLKLPGEESIETIIRETSEELGIALDKSQITFVGPKVADTNLIVDIFISYADVNIDEIKIQEEEVEEFRVVTKEELLELDFSTTCQYVYEKEFIDILFHKNI